MIVFSSSLSSTDLNSESESLYDWLFTVNWFVLATSPLILTTSNFIFQLNVCGYSVYLTSSLMRWWICCLQLLLVLARAVILSSESRGTHDHILLSQIQNSPKLEDQVPVLIPTRNRVARDTPPGTGFPLRRLLWFAGLRWRYSTPPTTRSLIWTQLCYLI
jgi:hypothetical protein